MNAYILADQRHRCRSDRGDLAILGEGDRSSFNQYGVVLVNPEKHPSVKRAAVRRSSTGSCRPRAEGNRGYKIGGDQLFYPNADQPGA